MGPDVVVIYILYRFVVIYKCVFLKKYLVFYFYNNLTGFNYLVVSLLQSSLFFFFCSFWPQLAHCYKSLNFYKRPRLINIQPISSCIPLPQILKTSDLVVKVAKMYGLNLAALTGRFPPCSLPQLGQRERFAPLMRPVGRIWNICSMILKPLIEGKPGPKKNIYPHTQWSKSPALIQSVELIKLFLDPFLQNFELIKSSIISVRDRWILFSVLTCHCCLWST